MMDKKKEKEENLASTVLDVRSIMEQIGLESQLYVEELVERIKTQDEGSRKL